MDVRNFGYARFWVCEILGMRNGCAEFWVCEILVCGILVCEILGMRNGCAEFWVCGDFGYARF